MEVRSMMLVVSSNALIFYHLNIDMIEVVRFLGPGSRRGILQRMDIHVAILLEY